MKLFYYLVLTTLALTVGLSAQTSGLPPPNVTIPQGGTGAATAAAALANLNGVSTAVTSTQTGSGPLNFPQLLGFQVGTDLYIDGAPNSFSGTYAGSTVNCSSQGTCAFAFATALVNTAATSVGYTMHIGNNTGACYGFNAPIVLPNAASGASLSIVGSGKNASQLCWTGSSSLSSTFITQPSQTSNAGTLQSDITGITIDAKGLVGACFDIFGSRRGNIDITCLNAAGSDHAVELATTGTGQQGYEFKSKIEIFAYQSFSGSYPQVTVTPSGGSVVTSGYTIVHGGTGLPSNLTFSWYYPHNYAPCSVMPDIPTATITGGVLTAVTQGTNTGTGCSGTMSLQAHEAGTVPIGLKVYASDSLLDYVEVQGYYPVAGVEIFGGSDYINFLHVVGRSTVGLLVNGAGFGFGYMDNDSPGHYGIDWESSQGYFGVMTSEWSDSTSFAGSSGIYLGSGETNVSLGFGMCSGNQGSGGYHLLETSTGPVEESGYAGVLSSGTIVRGLNACLSSGSFRISTFGGPDLNGFASQYFGLDQYHTASIGLGAPNAEGARIGFNNSDSSVAIQGMKGGVEMNCNNGSFGSGHCAVVSSGGIFGVGTNAPASVTSDPIYFDANGLTHLNGTAPAASVGTVTGTNSGGYISGLSAATTVTLTFANGGFTTWASCGGTPSVSLATPVYVSAQSATACTFTMPALTGTLYYHVDGK